MSYQQALKQAFLEFDNGTFHKSDNNSDDDNRPYEGMENGSAVDLCPPEVMQQRRDRVAAAFTPLPNVFGDDATLPLLRLHCQAQNLLETSFSRMGRSMRGRIDASFLFHDATKDFFSLKQHTYEWRDDEHYFTLKESAKSQLMKVWLGKNPVLMHEMAQFIQDQHQNMAEEAKEAWKSRFPTPPTP